MREIKFRAWDGERMLPVAAIERRYEHYDGHGYFETTLAVSLADGSNLRYSPEYDMMVHVMQYTGLKDRNGVEIYEGDIVRQQFDFPMSVESGVVEWVDRNAAFEVNGRFMGSSQGRTGSEVIGNIYENPDLLEAAS